MSMIMVSLINARNAKPTSVLTASPTLLNVLNALTISSSFKLLMSPPMEPGSLDTSTLALIPALKDSSPRTDIANPALITALPAKTTPPAKSARKDSYSKETNVKIDATNSSLKETENVSDVLITVVSIATISTSTPAKSARNPLNYSLTSASISALVELTLRKSRNSNSALTASRTALSAKTKPPAKSAKPDSSSKTTNVSTHAMMVTL
jgi:hypothetical protein